MFGWFKKRDHKLPELQLDTADRLILANYEAAQNLWCEAYKAEDRLKAGYASLSDLAYARAHTKLSYERFEKAESEYKQVLVRLQDRARAALERTSVTPVSTEQSK